MDDLHTTTPDDVQAVRSVALCDDDLAGRVLLSAQLRCQCLQLFPGELGKERNARQPSRIQRGRTLCTVRKLFGEQSPVNAALFEQLVLRAALAQASFGKYQDLVAVHGG